MLTTLERSTVKTVIWEYFDISFVVSMNKEKSKTSTYILYRKSMLPNKGDILMHIQPYNYVTTAFQGLSSLRSDKSTKLVD